MRRGRRPVTPAPPRPIGWRRAVNVALRTGHLLSVAVLVGGAVFDVDARRLAPSIVAAVATGGALAAVEIAASPAWPSTVKGVTVLAKVALLSLLPFFPERRVSVLVLTLVVSAAVAHLPARLRHRQLLPGRAGGRGQPLM